jgi:Domain of unknown function (DUF4124)
MRKLPSMLLVPVWVAMTTVLAQTDPLPSAWKWRDASGQINVSDLPPPPSIPAKDILERPPVERKAAPAPRAAASAVVPALHSLSTPKTDPELEARRKRALEEQAAQQRQQQEQADAVRAENCRRAQSAQALLSDGQRVSRTNAQGEREVLDDAARAAELQRIRAVIASDCR